MDTFRVVIAGGREFKNYDLLKSKLDQLLGEKFKTHRVEIVSGKARGADALGERYAKENGLQIHAFHANWDLWGKSAGYRRNEAMAKNSDATVAFWDGVSRGTKHMIDLTTKTGNLLRVVRYG